MNLCGAVNGIVTFAPRTIEHGRDGCKFDDRVFESLKSVYSGGRDTVEPARETGRPWKKPVLYHSLSRDDPMLWQYIGDVLGSLPPEDADPPGVAGRRAAMVRFRRERAEQLNDE